MYSENNTECSNNNRFHPAQFPEQLANDHIVSWSNEGDLIYDPFMGSGTTAKMAIINKRNWIGSEISEEYCKIIERRITLKLTGAADSRNSEGETKS
jgi:DNA modification methylase